MSPWGSEFKKWKNLLQLKNVFLSQEHPQAMLYHIGTYSNIYSMPLKATLYLITEKIIIYKQIHKKLNYE